MKKVIWLLFSLFMINSAFCQSTSDHTIKIKKSNNSSKSIEVEIVYKKKPSIEKKDTQNSNEKTRFLIKRKDKGIESEETSVESKNITKAKETNTIVPFNGVDLVPSFSNCKINNKRDSKKCFKAGISRFIQENFQYPEEAIENGVVGKVTIKFIVNKNGKVDNVIATDTNDIDTLTSYSVELISKLPKLEPARLNGKPVASSYEFQLDFSL
jgi:TonB family protein